MKTLIVGTRPSALAVKQAEEIEALLHSVKFRIVTIETRGDRDMVIPLHKAEGSDFFTKEIEDALVKGSIDAAIHSAKDLEEELPEDLSIAAITKPISRYECLVSKSGKGLDALPAGSVVGTSSAKRKEAILRYRSDLMVKDIRGTIGSRLSQLDRGDFDAIIVAHAALLRLGLEDRISQIIPVDIMAPHPLQGSLAVEVREDRKDIIEIFRGIDAR